MFYNDTGVVEINGLINREPEVRDKNTRLYLSVSEIKAGEGWQEISGTVLITIPRYPVYKYGDILHVTGKLQTPIQFDEFDYKGYLANQSIYSTMYYPRIEIVDIGKGLEHLEWIYSFRNRLSQSLGKILPEPQSSLAQGIILGNRGNIPSSVKTDFAYSGITHILAISGLHLSIIAGVLLSFGQWIFGRRGYVYIWLALVVIWLYALLTGMHPPVLRAAIMVSLFLLAEALGRQRNGISALVFAAAIMVGISPAIIHDASFQLSFAAMAGLIFVFPAIQNQGRRAIAAMLGEEGTLVSLSNFIVDSFSVSIGAIMAVWPLVAYYFDIVSWVAPFSTFCVLLALPAIIMTGAIAGILGILILPIGQVIGWLVWLFTSYIMLVADVFSSVPIINAGSIDIKLIYIYYAVLVSLLWLNSNRQKVVNLIPHTTGLTDKLPVKWIISPLIAITILVSVTAVGMPDNNLHISFLDVGQGDSILIQKGNQQILVDGGPSPQSIALALGNKMPFWDRTIDLVILTHPSADHVTGLVEVLNRYNVKQVLYPNLDFKSDIYDEWLNLLSEKDIKCKIACAGQRIDFGNGVIIDLLNPQTPHLVDTESDIDNNAVVIHIITGKISFLLTADLMWEGELELIMERADLKSTVLKVGHHGSATSTSTEFLSVVNPQVAVISVGADNTYGHPTVEVLDRLEQQTGEDNIYRTDENGTIEFITDGKKLWVSTKK